MSEILKSSFTTIDSDADSPTTLGKAFVDLKSVPNGKYTVLYMRIGQPLSLKSRFKILGRANKIFINSNRSKRPSIDITSFNQS